jgi:hypothetical protein
MSVGLSKHTGCPASPGGTLVPTEAAPGAPDAPNAPDALEYANMAESAAHEAAHTEAPIRYAVRLDKLMHAPLYHSSLALTVARLLLRDCGCEAVVAS